MKETLIIQYDDDDHDDDDDDHDDDDDDDRSLFHRYVKETSITTQDDAVGVHRQLVSIDRVENQQAWSQYQKTSTCGFRMSIEIR